MLRRQPIEGRLNSPLFIGPFQSQVRLAQLGDIVRLGDTPLPFAIHVQAHDDPLLPFQADGRVDRDPIQPGEKLSVPFEAIQRLVSVQKGFLDDVLSVFRAVDQSEHGVEEPVLIAMDQLSKGRGLAFQAISNESVIVAAHDSLFG